MGTGLYHVIKLCPFLTGTSCGDVEDGERNQFLLPPDPLNAANAIGDSSGVFIRMWPSALRRRRCCRPSTADFVRWHSLGSRKTTAPGASGRCAPMWLSCMTRMAFPVDLDRWGAANVYITLKYLSKGFEVYVPGVRATCIPGSSPTCTGHPEGPWGAGMARNATPPCARFTTASLNCFEKRDCCSPG